ncbi:MAG: hypothetical protein AB7O24_02400 [Kofleriaceae bacterium]
MSEQVDIDLLRELGETSTNASNAWAGADNYLTRGMVIWTSRIIGDNQVAAVRAALAACALVVPSYPTTGGAAQAPRRYIDEMLAAIQRWTENPSHSNKETVRSSLDTTRQLHAWQGHQDSPQFWTLEAVDHTCLAVWSGGRSSYIVPLDFTTCVARSATCVLRSLLASGHPEQQACEAVLGAIRSVTG